MVTVHREDLELLERLGGSRAAVHRATIGPTGRVVVVKHAPWDRSDATASLQREAHVLERISSPSLIELLARIEDDVGVALVLHLAVGGNLQEQLRRGGPHPPAETATTGAAVADALAALHAGGIVHRDVQPANILLDAELQPLLADLDHALDPDGEALEQDEEVVGHPQHVDHRLFDGSPPGPASDLHALATTLWTLATGDPPTRSEPTDPVTLPEDPRVPPPLRAVLEQCLDAVTTDAEAVAASLRAVADELAGVTVPADNAAPAPPPEPPATSADGPPGRPQHSPGSGAAAEDESSTRRWGPPRPSTGEGDRKRRLAWTAAAVGLLAIPAVLLGGSRMAADTSTADPVASSGIASSETDDPGASAQADPAASTTEEPAESAGDMTPVTPPPACEEPVPAGSVLADLDGDGCSEALRLVDGVLLTPTGEFSLGEPGDVLVAGDWDGDAAWSPGLYRPETGEAFLFDGAPGVGTITSRPAEQLAAGGRPVVTDQDGDGSHELVVAQHTT